jgi:hypothetical protein
MRIWMFSTPLIEQRGILKSPPLKISFLFFPFSGLFAWWEDLSHLLMNVSSLAFYEKNGGNPKIGSQS